MQPHISGKQKSNYSRPGSAPSESISLGTLAAKWMQTDHPKTTMAGIQIIYIQSRQGSIEFQRQAYCEMVHICLTTHIEWMVGTSPDGRRLPDAQQISAVPASMKKKQQRKDKVVK